jgi:ABC-type transport system involved in cytochrome bd biosynthesis fused ATPase/permease subunit
VIITLEQLNVRTTLLSVVAVVIIATLALTLALAFGMGNRELARHIMAGFHVKESFTPGQKLTVRHHTGRLVSIRAVNSIIETDAGRVSIPNDVLISEEVVIISEHEDIA